jgi:hypothetical protein
VRLSTSISRVNVESINRPKGPFHCKESMTKYISPERPEAGGPDVPPPFWSEQEDKMATAAKRTTNFFILIFGNWVRFPLWNPIDSEMSQEETAMASLLQGI